MKHPRRLTILALVVGMVGALLATAGIASEHGPVYVDRGVLLLHTGDDGYSVDWYDAPVNLNSPPTASQVIAVDSKCNATSSGSNLITIIPTGGNGMVGAVSHGLGVKTKNNCSTDQGQIEVGEKLKLSLGAAFNDTFAIESAEVDVEGKRNAKLGVTYLPGSSGENLTLTNTSDNGPDSGTGDNNIVTLGSGMPPFRAVEFHPVAGGSNSPAVAIEGGGDGTVAGGVLRGSLETNDSVFELVQEFDGELNCGETAETGDGFTDALGSFTRTLNSDGTACVAKYYNQDSTGDVVTFLPSGDDTGQANAAFVGELVFPPATAINPLLTELEYDPDGGTAYQPLLVCSFEFGTLPAQFTGAIPEVQALLEQLNGTPLPSGNLWYPVLPEGETWCVTSQNTATLSGVPVRYQTSYGVYGENDPSFRFS